jgi:chromate reductase, NAD(P)H dehydrogenase (quinone)
MSMNVAVLVGSLRKESFNLKMAKALIGLAPKSLQLQIVPIGNLPLYNQDLDDEGNVPAAWSEFRQQIKPCQGVLFVTPEYNRSVPGVLKNAIDVGSRPYGQSIWEKKPAAVISVSPGAIGGFGANQHLRQALVFLDMPPMQQPEAYIGRAGELFTPAGEIAAVETKKFLEKFMDKFAQWIAANKPKD